MKKFSASGFLLACLALFGVGAFAQQPSPSVYTPLFGVAGVPPNSRTLPARPAIMLNISRDHQLYYKAYNEYSSYVNTPVQGPDMGYLHNRSKPYSGYFDAAKCYVYNSGLARFVPFSMADRGTYYCSGDSWSGNFLNWATMTRIDIVRKVLYGGHREIDSGGLTVLRRSYIPMDAHSFAKYYVGGGAGRPGLSKLTPYSDGDSEITICNTTVAGDSAFSQSVTAPPLMRVVKGNYSLWSAHERRQCRYDEERDWSVDGSTNSNNPGVTGLNAFPGYPNRPSGGGYGDHVVQVEVCKPSLIGLERCKEYPNGNFKPTGLLHEYGETDRAEFGLITGTYSNNIQGGIVRKNVSSFKDEVSANSGTFAAGVNGIVATLNKLRIHGYRYSNATHTNPDGSFCSWQMIGLTNGTCSGWGNPMGEVFVEALRYFKGGGSGPSATYGGNRDAAGRDLGLVDDVTWRDPFTRGAAVDSIFGKPHCRAINIVNFNASVTSYDNDQAAGPFSTLTSTSLNSYIDGVGAGEGINGRNWFVGTTSSNSDKSCTSKYVSGLSDVKGLCPLGPGYFGSFSLAGAAYWAHTHPVRSDLPMSSGTLQFKDPNFRVNTFGVFLAPGVPRIETIAPSGRKVIIQPSYLLDDVDLGKRGGKGTLVDFRVISHSPGSGGKYLVVWEDSEQGGDYDQDAAGILSWNFIGGGSQIQVTTQVYADSSYGRQGFGYTISGTNKDGAHYHSGIHNFVFSDPTGAPSCQVERRWEATPAPGRWVIEKNGCSVGDPAVTATYNVTGGTGGVLEDPLYFAAKWGGFTVSSAGDVPNTSAKWDSRDADGDVVSDGVPDNYFLVFNPSSLEAALRRALNATLSVSNASAAVSSSQLTTGAAKYVAEFDPNDPVSGDVKAYLLKANGDFNSTAAWSVGGKLADVAHGDRQVITNAGHRGVPFKWGSLGPDYREMLTDGTSALTAPQAQELVNYIRGRRIRELGVAGTSFGWRPRPAANILGPVVSAAPWVQTKPSALYFDSYFSDYSAFANTHKSRPKVLWVASGDGMVHGVRAEDSGGVSAGTPLISYVPWALGPRLNEQVQSNKGVLPFVDGAPFTGDVRSSAGWRTFLFGSLGRGGRAIYALDVTNPASMRASNASSIFRWNFTADDDSDLGYILSDYSIKRSSGQASPIVKLNNDKFAVIFGNGYGSAGGKAALMILPVDGPASATGDWAGRFYKLVADASGDNGLSAPTWVDVNNDGKADYVYAGDLKGNLWKFDISSTNPSQWSVAFSGGGCGASSTCKPLYIARDESMDKDLPITSAPDITAPPFGGLMVNFGTGASYADDQFPSLDRTYRFYGIWDRADFSANPRTRSLPRGLSKLERRTFTRSAGGQVLLSNSTLNAVDYLNTDPNQAQDGWYVNLPTASEMVVSNPQRILSSLFFVSIRPNSNPTSCDGLPEASLFSLDPVSGLPAVNVFGMQSGQKVVGIPISDQKIAFALDRTGRAPTYGGSLQSSSGRGVVIRGIAKTEDTGIQMPDQESRLQWREVPGLRTFSK